MAPPPEKDADPAPTVAAPLAKGEDYGARVLRLSTACTGALSPDMRCVMAPYTSR